MFTSKMRYLIHNMQILRCSVECAWNSLPWVCTGLVIYNSWYHGFKDEMYVVLLFNIFTVQMLKCSIIASKYCTLGYEKLE